MVTAMEVKNRVYQQDTADRKRWEDLECTIQYGDAQSAFFGALAAHKGAGHILVDFFHESRCQTCGWQASLMNWEHTWASNRPYREAAFIHGPVDEDDEYKRRPGGLVVIDQAYR